MLFPLIKKTDWTNPLRGAYQFVMIGVMGVCLYFYDGSLVNIGQKPEPVKINAVGATQLNQDLVKALQDKSLDEKEKVYKVLAGVADYLKNSERIHSNRILRDVIAEVYLTYQMEEYSYLDPITVKASEESGILKDDSLIKVKDKAIDTFEILAESAKYSIQTTKEK